MSTEKQRASWRRAQRRWYARHVLTAPTVRRRETIVAKPKGRAGLRDGQVVATITDQFGEPRQVVQRGSRIRIAQKDPTPVIAMNREVAVVVGRKIREARLARGFTLEELAIRCGMTSGWPKNRMYEIESGTRSHGLRFGTLFAVAAALNVEATGFMPTVSEVLAKTGVQRAQARIVQLTGGGKVVPAAQTGT